MANYAIDTAPGLQANFGQLGGFTRAGFTGHYYHLVVANQLDYFL
jgi:cell wall assembly regulator SMI1